LPSVKTALHAVDVAGVVSELVVPRPAQGVAVAAKVVRRAHHPVLVLELGVALLMDAVRPVGAGRDTLLLGQAADQSLGNWK
jgi:hypothetical protein